jgi:hypothetical protein
MDRMYIGLEDVDWSNVVKDQGQLVGCCEYSN